MRYLPAWVPGAGFQSTAKLWKATVMEVAEKPMQFVQKQMAERSHTASYVSTLLEAHGDSPMGKDEYNIVKWSAASAYAGGADTVSQPLLILSCLYASWIRSRLLQNATVVMVIDLLSSPSVSSPLSSWP